MVCSEPATTIYLPKKHPLDAFYISKTTSKNLPLRHYHFADSINRSLAHSTHLTLFSTIKQKSFTMSVARTTIGRTLHQAARRAPVGGVAVTFRAYATESKNLKREIVSEKAIPVTAFKDASANSTSPGTASPVHFTIPVRGSKPAAESPSLPVTPLTKDLFSRLPPTVQKMTVMGKVVIVTG